MYIPASTSTEFRFGIRSFIVTCLFITPLMALFGWFNMVVRLNLPFSPEVLAGPIVVGLLMSIAVAVINTVHFIKTSADEQTQIKELNETQIEVILTLSEVAESRCEETGAHIKRVDEYSRLMAQLAGLQEEEVSRLKNASPLHDIGKIGTPDYVLLKPSKLTPEEFAIIEEHAEIGYRILAYSTKPILKTAAIIARNHHEKWDGSGYPQRLSGEAIPLYGRIVAIADVFDALGSDRVYKKAWSMQQIRDYFQEQSGRHFDPHLAKLFLDNFQRFEAIRKQYE
ncbi:MAG: HD domain-containing protein [Desulfocapsaceae bacterium]|nr:HD domain-containing protein [Desulfocapsaceae bacterium]